MKRALVLAVLLAPGVARADDRAPQALFGLRISLGELPLAPQPLDVGELGLAVEHPLAYKLRAYGEYEFLFLSSQGAMGHDVGTGHVARIGLRRTLAAATVKHAVRFYIDGELGGGVALTDDTLAGARVLPHAIAGLRFGYDLVMAPKKTFEAELLLRAIAIDRGVGYTFGVGLAFGG
jgi:hypothetical protein